MTINIKGYDVLIDNDIASVILARKWHVSRRKKGVYFATSVFTSNGRTHEKRLHRVIAGAPPNVIVDHINGNTLDNRRENLRWCSAGQNTRNRNNYGINRTGHKGVIKVKDRYRAKVTFEGKHIHIGYFHTPEEAAEAYRQKARELFGEFYNEGNAI